jgi:hypothetical protein
MTQAVIDISGSPYRLLTSARPVEFFNLQGANGILSIPISPARLFVAVNDDRILDKLRRATPGEIADRVNTYVVSRARRFVWTEDVSQQAFIESRMSSQLELTPLLPNIDRYEPQHSSVSVPIVIGSPR